MAKLMNFDSHVREVFENDEVKFAAFNKLMLDTSVGKYEEGISAKDANEKIVKIFKNSIGLADDASNAEVRKAMKKRANQQILFDLIEEVVPNLLKSGWTDNPFFNEFVEIKSMNTGDTNEFYVPDETVLTVSELSGNHHSLFRQRLGAGSTFSVKTSWYGVKS